MRILLFILAFFIYSKAITPLALQFSGIKVLHQYSNGLKEEILIERIVNKKCLKIQISSENFSDKNIKENIPKECKKTLISSKGVIQPFSINKKIKTYGELEVLYFIFKKSQKEKNKYILVDSRRTSWFDEKTIPSARSIPFEDLEYDEDFEEEFYTAYKNLGIKIISKNKYDFTEVKTAVFFCNGAWCSLSSKSIKYLLSIGYPEDKLIWYRGGLASWEALSLSITKQIK